MVDYSVSPLAVDTYARVMANVFDESSVIGVPTGMQMFFGQPETASQTLFSPDSLDVDIDIIRGNERTSALVPRGTNSRPLGTTQLNSEVTKFSNVNRVYPLSIEESDIGASQLLRRLAGDSPYEVKTRRQRLRTLAMRAHQEQIRKQVRLFEKLASQSILTGTQSAILGTTDPDLIYNFLRTASHSVTLGTQWTNAAADALGDIDDGWDLIRQDGHENADMMVTNGDTFEAFLLNTAILAKADNRRFEMIFVNQELPVPQKYQRWIDGGFTARGRLLTPRGHLIWMFTYEEIFTLPGGTSQKYIPDGKVIIAYSGARCDRQFGPPELLPDIPMRTAFYQQLFGFDISRPNMPPNVKAQSRALKPGMIYFDAYAPESWQRVTARAQSGPIFATTQTDCFVVIENAI